jgi:hypothetical protein
MPRALVLWNLPCANWQGDCLDTFEVSASAPLAEATRVPAGYAPARKQLILLADRDLACCGRGCNHAARHQL